VDETITSGLSFREAAVVAKRTPHSRVIRAPDGSGFMVIRSTQSTVTAPRQTKEMGAHVTDTDGRSPKSNVTALDLDRAAVIEGFEIRSDPQLAQCERPGPPRGYYATRRESEMEVNGARMSNLEKLCPSCEGEGQYENHVVCATCEGRGVVPLFSGRP
jgi:hypothetical protein